MKIAGFLLFFPGGGMIKTIFTALMMNKEKKLGLSCTKLNPAWAYIPLA